jgi:hypothetical protein
MSQNAILMKPMFEVVEKPYEHIFRLQAATQYDLGEGDKAMSQSVDRPCELIFYLLGIQKQTWMKLRK